MLCYLLWVGNMGSWPLLYSALGYVPTATRTSHGSLPVLFPRPSTTSSPLSMDTTPVHSNSMSSTTTTATPAHNAGRRPQPSNITNLNAPAATRIPPSLQAKMAAVGTPLLPSTPPLLLPDRSRNQSPSVTHITHSLAIALAHLLLISCSPPSDSHPLSYVCRVLKLFTSSSLQVLNRSRDNAPHNVDATINGFIRMQLADRPPLPLATASTPGLGAHGVASRRLGRPGLKLSDIEGVASGAKAAGLAQGRPSVLTPPRKPPSAGENGTPFANFSKIVCVSTNLLPLLYLYLYLYL